MDFPVKEGDAEQIDDLDMPMTFELALQDNTKVAFFEGTCTNPGPHRIETINAGQILVRLTQSTPPPTPHAVFATSPSSDPTHTAKRPHQTMRCSPPHPP